MIFANPFEGNRLAWHIGKKATGQVLEPGRRVFLFVGIATLTAAATCSGHGIRISLPRGFTQGLEVEGEGALHQEHQR